MSPDLVKIDSNPGLDVCNHVGINLRSLFSCTRSLLVLVLLQGGSISLIYTALGYSLRSTHTLVHLLFTLTLNI